MFGARIVVAGGLSAGAIHLRGMAAIHRQQPAQRRGAGAVHRTAHRHFDRLQVQRRAFPLGAEDYLEKRLDFPRDFLMNRSSRFFSSSLQPPGSDSTGRSWQICSFKAVNWALSC